MKPAEAMTLRDYLAILRRRRLIVIGAALLAFVVAFLSASLQTPIYSSSSEVIIRATGQDGLFDGPARALNARMIATEIEVIEGEEVRNRVQSNLGLAELPPPASASSVGETDVIRVAVRDANAANAQTLANEYSQAYIEVRREQAVGELLAASAEVQVAIDGLQAQLDSLADDDPRRPGLVTQQANFQTTLDQLRVDSALRTGGVAVVRSAPLPSDPVEPQPARTAMLAGAIGLLIGLVAALLIDYLDDKVRSEEDLERLTARPVLAVVPVDPPPDNRPIAMSEPGHAAVEAYRGLRTNLQFLGLDRAIRVIQLTSSMAGEGKTTTSTNLAVVLAQAGHRVALVDADLRRPRIHGVFGLPQSPGFTDLLLGVEARLVVNHIDIGADHRLSVYTSGSVPSNPSELLSGRRVRQLLDEMGSHYDYVIVDSAPVLPVSDSVALSGAADAVLVVAQAGRVTDGNVVETLERLDRVAAQILGLVLNQATEVSGGYDAYGGYGTPSAPPAAGRSVGTDAGDEPVSVSR